MNLASSGRLLKRSILLIGCLMVWGLPAPAAPRVVWSWSQRGTEILGPVFSANGKEMAFVRQAHWPRGTEATHVGAEVMDRLKAQRSKNPRFADPQVTIAQIGRKAVTRVAWGWEPQFAPDGKTLAYVMQKKPISGLAVSPKTLEGNAVALYNRAAKRSVVLARPEVGYLASPMFSASGAKLAYLMEQALTRNYGAGVGVGVIDVKRRKAFPLLSPQKKDGLFRLVGPPLRAAGLFAVLRVTTVVTPAGPPGRPAAPQILFEILGLGTKHKVLYTWGLRPQGYVPIFGVSAAGAAVIYDGGWFRLDLRNGRKARLSDQDTATNGVISPNVQSVAEIDNDSLFVGDIGKARHRVPIKINGRPRGVQWAPDSKSLAMVVAHYRKAKGKRDQLDYDELIVVRL